MDANEVLARQNVALDLAAKAHQLDFEAYYRMPLARHTRLAGNLFVTRNPDHAQGTGTAFAVSASLRHEF